MKRKVFLTTAIIGVKPEQDLWGPESLPLAAANGVFRTGVRAAAAVRATVRIDEKAVFGVADNGLHGACLETRSAAAAAFRVDVVGHLGGF